MKKQVLFWLICLFPIIPGKSQSGKAFIDISKLPAPQSHYLEEYTFDSPSDLQAWEAIKPGLHAGFGTDENHYLRCEIPADINESARWTATGWRGQSLNTLILVWSSDSLDQLRMEVKDLTDGRGNFIEIGQTELNLVRYVLSNYPRNGIARDCAGPMDSTWLMPDRFEAFDRFDLPANSVRPVWLQINIPETAIPGKYRGRIEISSNHETKSLLMDIVVQNLVLPRPEDWKFRLDLWQNPWVVAGYFNLKPWSEEHIFLLKKHMKPYADAGGSFITTYAVHSPWSDNSYRIEGGMIEWIRLKDGSWDFDYSIFDRYVELCMSLGIDEAITIYTPLPWGNRFRYLDQKTGNYIYEEWPVGSDQFKNSWNSFLDDLQIHLAEKNWLEITYLGINENPMDVTLAAIQTLREHPGNWKITYAGDWHPELSGLIDDYCSVISSEPGYDEIHGRRESGFTSTFYVCCTPARPNNFVFSPPVEGRYLGWHAIARGYDGFLRWAYDAWPADPMRDARHTFWPAGDCFMIYPGGQSCIRFEKLREGIVDFEKVRILKEMAEKSNQTKVKALMEELENHLDSVRMDQEYSQRDYSISRMKTDISRGEELIVKLSEALSK